MKIVFNYIESTVNEAKCIFKKDLNDEKNWGKIIFSVESSSLLLHLLIFKRAFYSVIIENPSPQVLKKYPAFVLGKKKKTEYLIKRVSH